MWDSMLVYLLWAIHGVFILWFSTRRGSSALGASDWVQWRE